MFLLDTHYIWYIELYLRSDMNDIGRTEIERQRVQKEIIEMTLETDSPGSKFHPIAKKKTLDLCKISGPPRRSQWIMT